MPKKLNLALLVFCFYLILTNNLAFSQEKFIKKIEFVGNDGISKETLLDIIDTEAGDIFSFFID